MSSRLLVRRVGALPLAPIAEGVFAVGAIYLLGGGPLHLPDFTGQADPVSLLSEGDPLTYAVLSGTYLVALLLLLRYWRAAWRAVTADLSMAFLLGITLASTVWSEAPDVTLRRGLGLVGGYVMGMYLIVRYRPEEQLRLLGTGLGVLVVMSLLVALTHPGMLVQDGFQGIFVYKNVLGRIMVLALLVYLCLTSEPRWRMSAFVLGSLAVGLLVSAKSATAVVVLLTVLGLYPLVRILKKDVRVLVVAGIAAVLVVGLAVVIIVPNVGSMTSVFGRDTTLTGRTELWRAVVDMIFRRPWLGYGYEAFWLASGTLRLSVDEATAGWIPEHAHNGFLEVGLALGLIGFGVFVFGFLRGMARALIWSRRWPGAASPWPAMFLSFLLLYNMTESTALARNSVFWVLYVTTLASVSPRWLEASARVAVRRQATHRRLLPAPATSRPEPVAPDLRA